MRLPQITLMLALAGLFPCLHADDLEVYANPSNVDSAPNLLFVFDSSASMTKTPLGEPPSAGNPSRLAILKTAMANILSQDFDGDLNIGYMDFRNSGGNGIKFPIAGIDSDAHDIDPEIPVNTTVRTVIGNLVAANAASGQTPTVDALYEAARYFRGATVHLGKSGTFGRWRTDRNPPHYRGGYWRAAHPASYSGEKTYRKIYVDPETPKGNGVREWRCRDYSARPNSNRNDCASIPEDKLFNCTFYGVKACTNKLVDVCAHRSYPIQDSCLTGPGNSESTWLNSNSRKCCTSSDITNAECLSWLNLEKCDEWTQEERCVGGRTENQVYKECKYRYRVERSDNRRYKSPIGMQCQKNAIILLSDGAPSKNTVDWGRTHSNGRVRGPYHIRNMIYYGTNAVVPADEKLDSVHSVTCNDLSSSIFGKDPGKYRWGNCGPELAEFLHTRDQIPALDRTTVETYTIGFGLNGTGASEAQQYLRLLATKGGGNFYEANDVDSLVSSITSIISSITSDNQSLTGISLSIDANRMSTSDKTYVGQFVPSNQRSWEGNIKGYFLGPDGLLDINGELAVTAGEAEYRGGAQSFWSEAPDGANVIAGGLRGVLDPDSRTIYVNTNDTAPNGLTLKGDDTLLLHADNSSLTNSMLGLPENASTETRSDLIEWARSAQMRDPLHAVPTVVHYGGDTGEILFAMTNMGYLHAFDVTHPTETGDTTEATELFAFMPRALISNLPELKANGSSGQHIYGLDGPMTVLADDVNDDGVLDADDEDRVILYFGMRRGGNTYYAMDVSNPENPILLWRIDPDTTGFSGMGQSWSRMVLTTVKDGDGTRKVLIFGAGYDTDQDGYSQRETDDKGAGIYIIDAYTGELLMSFGSDSAHFMTQVADMAYSVPAEPRVVDIDNDGLADRIYAVDMGAQIWSIDLPTTGSLTDSSNYLVHCVADLGGDGVQDNRRFYYPPAISRVMRNGAEKLAIAIGSGFRAHPLNSAISDRFFVLFDDVEKDSGDLPDTLGEDDLFDLTNDLLGPGAAPDDIAAAKSSLALKEGWYMTLPSGRKVISEARILAGMVMFNAFSASGSVCEGVTTRNDFYLVSLLDARALVDLDQIEEEIKQDRWVTVEYSGIATAPSLVFGDPADSENHETPTMDIYVGQEKVWGRAEKIYKLLWKEVN